MKKFIALSLVLAILASFAACGKNTGDRAETTSPAPGTDAPAEQLQAVFGDKSLLKNVKRIENGTVDPYVSERIVPVYPLQDPSLFLPSYIVKDASGFTAEGLEDADGYPPETEMTESIENDLDRIDDSCACVLDGKAIQPDVSVYEWLSISADGDLFGYAFGYHDMNTNRWYQTIHNADGRLIGAEADLLDGRYVCYYLDENYQEWLISVVSGDQSCGVYYDGAGALLGGFLLLGEESETDDCFFLNDYYRTDDQDDVFFPDFYHEYFGDVWQSFLNRAEEIYEEREEQEPESKNKQPADAAETPVRLDSLNEETLINTLNIFVEGGYLHGNAETSWQDFDCTAANAVQLAYMHLFIYGIIFCPFPNHFLTDGQNDYQNELLQEHRLLTEGLFTDSREDTEYGVYYYRFDGEFTDRCLRAIFNVEPDHDFYCTDNGMKWIFYRDGYYYVFCPQAGDVWLNNSSISDVRKLDDGRFSLHFRYTCSFTPPDKTIEDIVGEFDVVVGVKQIYGEYFYSIYSFVRTS